MVDRVMVSPREMAKKFNISYQTINYYTNLGLLVVRRKKGNGRLYNQDEVRRRLEKIDKLKNRGYPLRLICNML